MSRFRQPSILPGFGLTLGFTTFFLSAIVLIPLAALIIKGSSPSLAELKEILLDPRALASYRLSFGAALLAAVVNAIFGFIVAWTLVRYEFPGRRLVDALIDLPFALPTAVSGIALTAVFAPNGWLGLKLASFGVQVAYTWIGVVVALILIGLPFVVRSVQPALIEVQRDLELFRQGERRARRLLAVAQGGVEHDDAVLLGLCLGGHWIIPSQFACAARFCPLGAL